MRKKLIGLVTVVIMFAGALVPAYADTQSDISAVKQQQSRTESDLSDANSQISALNSKKEELQTYLNDLNTQLSDLDSAIDDLNEQISDKETEIAMNEAALERAKLDEENQYEAMKGRIKCLYERRKGGVFLSVLESDNISEMLNQAENYNKLESYDRNMLQQYTETKNIIADKELELKDEQLSFTKLKSENEAKKAELEILITDSTSKINELVSEISDEELRASNLQSQIESQKTQLSRLEEKAAAEKAEAERKAAEEEAAKQLAAKKAAEEAAAKAAQSASSSKSTSSSKSSSSSKNTSSASNSSSSTDSKESENSNSSGSDSGSTSGGTYLGKFKLTAYCHCAKCCGRANAPTASGVMPTAGHTVAMAGVPFGTRLLINGTVYVVEDRGTSYGHVDVFMNSHSEALQFGLQYADVYQL